ncbi:MULTISPECIES: ABC transporter permease [Enterococcus]|uniref:ABC transporter permease n=1 Tax=Enterococcus TaxID=1350 RepID=UPI0011599F36|nr:MULTISPECIES: ABC transporter permease [Enterococcus]MBO6320367.1 ABC transporter permease [Enterococcus faecalis]MBO6345444.1 ABC transporter permease [Enterococcus faecalis]MBO6410206.1 ABC transporter permease [Enterococcus faecalis]MDQ8612410.1 ABC transporter permease [Enterococcus sp. FR111]MDQ8633738.1 ABC transporter permease [Enterococcus sp. FR112]
MDLATISSIITQTLVYATPLILTALGGTFSERSGVVNVGLEGIMVMGAFSSVVFNLTFADTFGAATPWIACLVGGVVGIVFSLLHAVATINLRADHIISGTVINLMAPALGVFLVKVIYQKGQTDMITQSFGYFSFPGLSKIPVIGELFFAKTSLPAFVAILIAILAWFVIYKTRFGLRLRSVGEHPQAADTLGINVYLMRYSGVLLSGFLGGMGGAVFAQSIAGRFGITTIAGQGFISMAAMIFGKWNPLGAMGAALFFGFAQNLSIAGENLPIISEIPKVYLQAAPYVLTILVLVLFFGKSSGPKANGKNYVKTK